ncbi:MAG TPA: efflux RND transporter periplasmic adaptor subunit [Gemmatimonadales bacterium]|nr:efflux RND transporter periplasmic adaptor subunit [Gemmatimonadales bacterium]
MMRTRVAVIGLIGLLVLGVVAVLQATGGSPGAHESPATQPAPAAVTVSAARRADLATAVQATGTVRALREARIAARMPGRVTAVLVEEGDQVAAGAQLLRLDGSEVLAVEAQARASTAAARAQRDLLVAGALPEERRQAANAVAQAGAALDQAKAETERMRALHAMGAVARQQLDAAETQLRVARSAYDSVRQQQRLVEEGPRVEQVRAAEAQAAGAEASLAVARVRVRDLVVNAPFAGTILQRMVEPGESVSPAVPSFLLAQIDVVDVELAVSERHRASLRVGQSAAITVDALPGRTFEGRIAEISPGASELSRSFVVKVRVANGGRSLQPGMFARGAIVTARRTGVLQVPEQAVLTTPGGSILFVVNGGRAARRAVTLGERQDGIVEIRTGVAAGEPVIVEGQEGLTDNQAVAPRTPRR